jgi:hypothetical protein
MALITLGTAATNTLNAVVFNYGMLQTDLGDFNFMIRDKPGAPKSTGRAVFRRLPGCP